jgi:hypothetical protein
VGVGVGVVLEVEDEVEVGLEVGPDTTTIVTGMQGFVGSDALL